MRRGQTLCSKRVYLREGGRENKASYIAVSVCVCACMVHINVFVPVGPCDLIQRLGSKFVVFLKSIFNSN